MICSTTRKRAYSRALAAVVIALVSAVAVQAAGAAVQWKGDFETGNVSQWSGNQSVAGGVTVVKSPLRDGSYSAKFVVKPGDDPINSTGERNELLRNGLNTTEGTEQWYGWSAFFPSDFKGAPNTDR